MIREIRLERPQLNAGLRGFSVSSFAIALLLLVFVVGCEPASESSLPPQSPGVENVSPPVHENTERLLAIAIAPSSQDYEVAIEDAIGAGMQAFEVPVPWDAVDKRENVALLNLFDTYLSGKGIRVVLALNPLDTLENLIPEDLQRVAFDNPRFIERFNSFADKALTRVSKLELSIITVGNEVDLLLGDSAERWQQYENFLVEVKRHLNETRPGLRVGVKVTFDAFQNQRERVDGVVAASDLVMITYFPLTDGFVRDVGAFRPEVEELVSAYPDKLIQLDVGYPSSSKLKSSPEVQADFVSSVFETWDVIPQVELVNFVWLNDIPPAVIRTLEQAHGDDSPFVSFLATLGLRESDGTPKASFERFRQEAHKRGFGSASR